MIWFSPLPGCNLWASRCVFPPAGNWALWACWAALQQSAWLHRHTTVFSKCVPLPAAQFDQIRAPSCSGSARGQEDTPRVNGSAICSPCTTTTARLHQQTPALSKQFSMCAPIFKPLLRAIQWGEYTGCLCDFSQRQCWVSPLPPNSICLWIIGVICPSSIRLPYHL